MAHSIPPTDRTVLVVEDQALIRMGTASFLQDEGYRVLEAANAPEALQTLRQHPEIDLLLTDVQMPGPRDGLELVETVGRKYPAIKAVIVSGRASVAQNLPGGKGHFVAKPYSPRQILTVMQRLLA